MYYCCLITNFLSSRYAIYIPLFLPIMIPIILSVRSIFKHFQGAKAKAVADESADEKQSKQTESNETDDQ